MSFVISMEPDKNKDQDHEINCWTNLLAIDNSGVTVVANVSSAEACNCNSELSESDVCDVDSGQCPCVAGVEGRTCDRCLDNYFNSTQLRGCKMQRMHSDICSLDR